MAATVCLCALLLLPLLRLTPPLPSSCVVLLTPGPVSQVLSGGWLLQQTPCGGRWSCRGEPTFQGGAWVFWGLGL